MVEEKNQAEKSAASTKNSQKWHFLLQFKITQDPTQAITDKVCDTCRDKDYIPNTPCTIHVKSPRNLRSKIPFKSELHFNTRVSFPRIQLGFNPLACRDMLFPLNKNKTTTVKVSTHCCRRNTVVSTAKLGRQVFFMMPVFFLSFVIRWNQTQRWSESAPHGPVIAAVASKTPCVQVECYIRARQPGPTAAAVSCGGDRFLSHELWCFHSIISKTSPGESLYSSETGFSISCLHNTVHSLGPPQKQDFMLEVSTHWGSRITEEVRLRLRVCAHSDPLCKKSQQWWSWCPAKC